MTQPIRNISYLLLLAVFASSLFGLSPAIGDPNDAGARLGPRVGASPTEQTVVGNCGKECESCILRERTCDLGHYRQDVAEALCRRLGGPSPAWTAGCFLRTSSSVAFVSTIRIQV